MAAPNHLFVIEHLAAGYNLGTKEGAGQFTEAAVVALHAHDRRWGHLKKNPGQTQYNGHSHDGALYLSDTPGESQHVDFIAKAEAPGAYVYWNPDTPRYSQADWYAPAGVPNPQPIPQPQPNPQPVPAPSCKFDQSTVLAELSAVRQTQQIHHEQLSNIHSRVMEALDAIRDARHALDNGLEIDATVDLKTPIGSVRGPIRGKARG
jgi:hypothetical protein